MSDFPGLDARLWQHGRVVCAQVSDWTSPSAGDGWVRVAEGIASALKVKLSRGFAFSGAQRDTADFKGPKAEGKWGRIRQRAINLLGEFQQRNVLELNTAFAFTVGEGQGDAFLSLSTSATPAGPSSKLCAAVSMDIASSPAELLEKLTPFLVEFDAKWGAAFWFPMAAGAGYYLSGAAYVSPEVRALVHDQILVEHERRLQRANFRTGSGYLYADGYVREIYELNLLSDRHLSAPLLSGTVRQYAEAVGSLEVCSWSPNLWRWTIDSGNLQQVRQDWEQSGLVLSGEAEPFRWQ